MDCKITTKTEKTGQVGLPKQPAASAWIKKWLEIRQRRRKIVCIFRPCLLERKKRGGSLT